MKTSVKTLINTLIFFAAFAMLLGGCRQGYNYLHPVNTPDNVWLRSYVMAYYEPDYIRGRVFSHEGVGLDEHVHLFSMHVIKKEVKARFDDTDPQRVRLFDSLCNVHGDMTFNRNYHLQIDGGKVEFPMMDLQSIVVTCLGKLGEDGITPDFDNTQFTAGYTHGTPLNDLMHVKLNSAQPFISSGYEDSVYVLEEPSEFFWSYIEKPMNQITVADLRLLGTGSIDDADLEGRYTDHLGLLIFNDGVEPDEPGIYTFKVEMTPSDGSDSFVWLGDMEFQEHTSD